MLVRTKSCLAGVKQVAQFEDWTWRMIRGEIGSPPEVSCLLLVGIDQSCNNKKEQPSYNRQKGPLIIETLLIRQKRKGSKEVWYWITDFQIMLINFKNEMMLLRILLVTLLTSLAATQPMNFVLNGDFSSANVSLANPRKKYTSNILGWYGVSYQIAIASTYTQNWWNELPVVVIGLQPLYQSVVLRVTAVYEISFMWCAIATANLSASTISVVWNQRPVFNGRASSYYPTMEKFMINSHAGINQLQFTGGNDGIIISKISITHRSAILNGELNYPPLVLNATTGSLVTPQQFGILGWASPIVQLVPGSNFNSNWRGVVIDTSVSQVLSQTFRTLPVGRVYSLTFQWASRFGSGFNPRAQQVSTYWNRKMVKTLYSMDGAIHSQHFQVFAFQGMNNLTFVTKVANPPITYGIALTNFKLVPKL